MTLNFVLKDMKGNIFITNTIKGSNKELITHSLILTKIFTRMNIIKKVCM